MSPEQNKKPIKLILSEYYRDLLSYDAYIAGQPDATQARSLIQSRLMAKESEIDKRLEELAEKKGIDVKELKRQIREGDFN